MNIKKYIRKVKRSSSTIFKFISIFSSLITILGCVYGILIRFFPGIETVKWLNALTQNGVTFKTFAASCMVSFILLLFIAIHYYRDGKDRLQLFTYEIRVVTEEYRDLIFTLEYEEKNYDLDVRETTRLVKEYCQRLLDSLCRMTEQITKSEVYGCIKLVNPADYNDKYCENFGDRTVSDLVRSSNSPDSRRFKNPCHKSKINENTDFLELMDVNNERSQFYQPDLLEYEKRLQEDDHDYKNSTPRWEKKYKSTAVVPIWIEKPHEVNQCEQRFDTLGFLCLDAEDTYVFHPKHKDFITSLMKGYASLLYCVLDSYYIYLRDVQQPDYVEAFCEKRNSEFNNKKKEKKEEKKKGKKKKHKTVK